MIIPSVNQIIEYSGIHISRIFNIYIFGSRVYGNYNNNSDWDVIIVANNSVDSIEIKNDIFNIHVCTPEKFKKDLNLHKITNLECIFAPDWAKILVKKNFNFELKKTNLRHFISHINSNSIVKCKKKILQDDYYIGVKSLFHSMRIANFGYQLATEGKISDFSCSNWIWEEINSKKWSWEELDSRWKPYNNEIMHEFRIKCSKK